MINVLLLSDELKAGHFAIHPISLPEAPVVGDRFKVTDFKYDGTAESLRKYLMNNNLNEVAEVSSRVWGTYEGKLALYVFLKFVEREAHGEMPAHFFF